jgi:hypothetical protein
MTPAPGRPLAAFGIGNGDDAPTSPLRRFRGGEGFEAAPNRAEVALAATTHGSLPWRAEVWRSKRRCRDRSAAWPYTSSEPKAPSRSQASPHPDRWWSAIGSARFVWLFRLRICWARLTLCRPEGQHPTQMKHEFSAGEIGPIHWPPKFRVRPPAPRRCCNDRDDVIRKNLAAEGDACRRTFQCGDGHRVPLARKCTRSSGFGAPQRSCAARHRH